MDLQPMTHEEALELAGLYVLDALSAEETRAVDAHLASCSEDHRLFVELRAITPSLASLAEPVNAPANLKAKVMEAYRDAVATTTPASASAPVVAPASMSAPLGASTPHAEREVLLKAPRLRRWQAPNWMGWAAAGIALVLVVILGAVGANLKSQTDQAQQHVAQMQQAITALSQPGAQVAVLRGSGAAAGVSGFVAVPPSGTGYWVMTDVPAAPQGMTYQAWYIAGGAPTSAGTMTADADGNVVAAGIEPVAGTSVVAVTIEPAGGSDQPTSAPIIVGNLSTTS